MQNQEDCTFTVLAFLPGLSDHILEALKVESITAELQAQKLGRASVTTNTEDDTSSVRSGYSELTVGRKSKLDLWNDIKITSITRIFALYYCIALLTVFTRVQLNLIGRSSYVASVVKLVDQDGEATITLTDSSEVKGQRAESDDLNRRYLIFSWWFLNKGWQGIVERVREAVTTVFGRTEIREEIAISQLRLLFSRVRGLVEFNGRGDDHYSWLSHVLPSKKDECFVLSQAGDIVHEIPKDLRNLLDETAGLVDSHEAALVLSRCLDVGVSHLVEVRMSAAYKSADKLRLANILPVITREAHNLASGDPNEYLEALSGIPELDGFSARLFTSFETLRR